MDGVTSTVDLTPVIESLEVIQANQVATYDALRVIQAYQAAAIGVILGGIVIVVLAVMFR